MGNNDDPSRIVFLGHQYVAAGLKREQEVLCRRREEVKLSFDN